jgi:hypothetical protein
VHAGNLVSKSELEKTRQPEVLINHVFPSERFFTFFNGELVHKEGVEGILRHHEGTLEAVSVRVVGGALSSLRINEGTIIHAFLRKSGFVSGTVEVVGFISNMSEESGHLDLAAVNLVVFPGHSSANTLNSVSGIKQGLVAEGSGHVGLNHFPGGLVHERADSLRGEHCNIPCINHETGLIGSHDSVGIEDEREGELLV